MAFTPKTLRPQMFAGGGSMNYPGASPRHGGALPSYGGGMPTLGLQYIPINRALPADLSQIPIKLAKESQDYADKNMSETANNVMQIMAREKMMPHVQAAMQQKLLDLQNRVQSDLSGNMFAYTNPLLRQGLSRDLSALVTDPMISQGRSQLQGIESDQQLHRTKGTETDIYLNENDEAVFDGKNNALTNADASRILMSGDTSHPAYEKLLRASKENPTGSIYNNRRTGTLQDTEKAIQTQLSKVKANMESGASMWNGTRVDESDFDAYVKQYRKNWSKASPSDRIAAARDFLTTNWRTTLDKEAGNGLRQGGMKEFYEKTYTDEKGNVKTYREALAAAKPGSAEYKQLQAMQANYEDTFAKKWITSSVNLADYTQTSEENIFSEQQRTSLFSQDEQRRRLALAEQAGASKAAKLEAEFQGLIGGSQPATTNDYLEDDGGWIFGANPNNATQSVPVVNRSQIPVPAEDRMSHVIDLTGVYYDLSNRQSPGDYGVPKPAEGTNAKRNAVVLAHQTVYAVDGGAHNNRLINTGDKSWAKIALDGEPSVEPGTGRPYYPVDESVSPNRKLYVKELPVTAVRAVEDVKKQASSSTGNVYYQPMDRVTAYIKFNRDMGRELGAVKDLTKQETDKAGNVVVVPTVYGKTMVTNLMKDAAKELQAAKAALEKAKITANRLTIDQATERYKRAGIQFDGYDNISKAESSVLAEALERNKQSIYKAESDKFMDEVRHRLSQMSAGSTPSSVNQSLVRGN